MRSDALRLIPEDGPQLRELRLRATATAIAMATIPIEPIELVEPIMLSERLER